MMVFDGAMKRGFSLNQVREFNLNRVSEDVRDVAEERERLRWDRMQTLSSSTPTANRCDRPKRMRRIAITICLRE